MVRILRERPEASVDKRQSSEGRGRPVEQRWRIVGNNMSGWICTVRPIYETQEGQSLKDLM